MGLAKCLGGFQNMPSVLQAPFSPWALGALSERVWLHKQGRVRKARVWVDGASAPPPVTVHPPALAPRWVSLQGVGASCSPFGPEGGKVAGQSGQRRCSAVPSHPGLPPPPRQLACVPVPSGGKHTAAFPWKTARCHKIKLLGGSGELSSSADCWEDRP